ncbi:MAG: 5' nucleotidase, NT5C type [Candidatus Woesearchaeota archaeon]
MKQKDKRTRKKVGVDLDDILFPFNKHFLIYRNKKHNTNYTEKVFRMSTEDIMKEMDDFYKTREYEQIEPVEDAFKALSEIKKTHDLAIVTARPEYLVEKTNRWLNKYFKNIFSEVIFTNQQSLLNKKRSKAEVCIEKSIEILIEDNFEYVIDCAQKGIRVLLFNKPWNINFSAPKEYKEFIVKIDGWNDVLRVYKSTDKFSNFEKLKR